jgi:hypothetical protein
MSADVHLIFHKKDRDATRDLRSHVADVCAEQNWNFLPRPVLTVRAPSGRPTALLARDLAMGLYPRAHRSRVATLVVGSDPRVALHPNEADALRFGRHIPLRRFIAYKSFWIRIPNDATNDSWVGAFAGWCSRTECDGEHDPRCLPFHVFSGDGSQLHNAASRQSFDEQYGAGARRVDDSGSQWILNPRDYHGQESLHIAGYQLRRGYHWDVTAEEWTVSTPVGLWRVDGHVNIYPDAHVRPRGSNVRKLI